MNPMPVDRTALLRGTELFSGLDDPTLAELAQRMGERTYPKGDIVFHEGDLGDRLFIVAEGLVKIFLTSPDGEEMVLSVVGPSGVFGELALIHRGQRSASARALEKTRLVSLEQEAFIGLLAEHPEMTRTVLSALGDLLESTLTQVADLVFLDLPGRVAKVLLRIAEEQGDENEVVRLEVSQTDLARMVGGSRPAVNQLLKRFESRGYVGGQDRNTMKLDTTALRRRAAL